MKCLHCSKNILKSVALGFSKEHFVVLYSTPDINYLLKKYQLHHKTQPAQVHRVKEEGNHQRLAHCHPQWKQRQQVPNEEKDDQLLN